MAGRREACLVVISILFLSTIQSVQAVTVVKADSVDLMPPDALNNATLWELSSSLNDTIPAHYSTISIEESGMVISHLRPENSATSVAWASTSSTNSVAAIGIPDGGVAVSKGPDIKISGFDKQKVGMITAHIKSLRPPEPYKGKGIREKGQYILRKEGKKK